MDNAKRRVIAFGFLVALTAKTGIWRTPESEIVAAQVVRGRPAMTAPPKPIAPFERDSCLAVQQAFDRVSGEAVSPEQLKSYAQCLAQYHLSSEDKFENGAFTDRGMTLRRHVIAQSVQLIGKEANKIGNAGNANPVCDALAEFPTTTSATQHNVRSDI